MQERVEICQPSFKIIRPPLDVQGIIAVEADDTVSKKNTVGQENVDYKDPDNKSLIAR